MLAPRAAAEPNDRKAASEDERKVRRLDGLLNDSVQRATLRLGCSLTEAEWRTDRGFAASTCSPKPLRACLGWCFNSLLSHAFWSSHRRQGFRRLRGPACGPDELSTRWPGNTHAGRPCPAAVGMPAPKPAFP